MLLGTFEEHIGNMVGIPKSKELQLPPPFQPPLIFLEYFLNKKSLVSYDF
jgi:hypothetical protein